MNNTENKLNWNHLKEKEMKNVEGEENSSEKKRDEGWQIYKNSPVEIIKERMKKLHTYRMDTRLRTPVREAKGWEGVKKKEHIGRRKHRRLKRTEVELAKKKRVESTWREMHQMKELTTQRTKTIHVILKKIWRGRGVIQNTYVKIPHQSDEGAGE